jgi:ubiquinone/menaquinone biosynthesis C-methylase UbiE
MRDPFGLNERFFARYYPIVMGWSEKAGEAERRHELIATATGRTLEIGAGSGQNLPHYPTTVTELTISEPSLHMIRQLTKRFDDAPPPARTRRLIQAGAEELPFRDGTFDTVVATFVHCSIPDPAAALREIARVLRPQGRYLFIEHVRSSDSPMLARFQDLVEVPHRYLAAGCYPNRRTERLLAESPLTVSELIHERMPRALPTVRPNIRGVAVKPA